MVTLVPSVDPIERARQERKAKNFKLWDPTGQLLPSNLREQRVAGYTDLARKYSHPIGNWIQHIDHRILRNTGKSGLTPIGPLNPDGLSNEVLGQLYREHVAYEVYQRRRLVGFTPDELKKIEALAGLDDTPMEYNLTNGIHPIFQLPAWLSEAELPKHQALIPTLGDYNGFWSVSGLSNSSLTWLIPERRPKIWEFVLAPCLRLATVILTSMSVYPWLDALFKGPIINLPTINPGDADKMWIFSQRIAAERNAENEFQDLQRKILDLSGKIRIGFRNTSSHYITGMATEDFTLGYTQTWDYFVPNNLLMLISVEVLETLLRQDLTDAERMVATLYVAHTLVHEFAIWGGETSHLHLMDYARGGPGLPTFGVCYHDWFQAQHSKRLRPHLVRNQGYTTSLLSINRLEYHDIYPVPISWVQSMFQEVTWNVLIKKIGAVTQMGPLTVGTRIFTKRDETPDDMFNVVPPNNMQDEYKTLRYRPELDLSSLDSGAIIHRAIQVDKIFNRMGLSPELREKARASNISLIIASTADGQLNGPNAFSYITGDPFDPLLDEEEIPDDEYRCPRWLEIVAYMCRNRAPLQLALDTMGTLPVPVFYRYIRERGGINLSGLELWNFLGVANSRKVFFIFDPYPGPGLVTIVEAGWPPAIPFSFMSIPAPKHISTAAEKDEIMAIIRQTGAQKFIFNRMLMQTMRDMDIDMFRLTVEENEAHMFEPDEFKALLIQCVRETWDFNNEFTLGTEGIIRFTYDMTTMIQESVTDQMMKLKFAEIKTRKDEIETEWRNKQLQGI
ncbi:hypothetical protein BDZ45DRAFT_688468 [Acephala macrosclerotiorum]|nr:hypothetical protein BDZ45DRAFT_688468 [Acephala macrosclerotiorum]